MNSKFRNINRLMGTAEEMLNQTPSGEDKLENMLNRLDPYWEDREETQMDIYRFQAPVTRSGDDTLNVTTTARGPVGGEGHMQNREIVMTEVIPYEQDA